VEGLGKVTPRIDVGQQVLNADPRQCVVDRAAQVDEPRWQLERITFFEMEPALANRHEVIRSQSPLRLLRRVIKGALELGAEIVGGLRQMELGLGIVPLVLPPRGSVDQMRKGHMAATFGEIHISGA
jgi:hypothetical protein